MYPLASPHVSFLIPYLTKLSPEQYKLIAHVFGGWICFKYLIRYILAYIRIKDAILIESFDNYLW